MIMRHKVKNAFELNSYLQFKKYMEALRCCYKFTNIPNESGNQMFHSVIFRYPCLDFFVFSFCPTVY